MKIPQNRCLCLSKVDPFTLRLHQSQAAFHAALCDSFNTPEAINIIRDLVARTNIYINTRSANSDISVVERIARWVGQMLRMFGLGEGESSEIGWGQELSPGEGDVNVRPFLHYSRPFHPSI